MKESKKKSFLFSLVQDGLVYLSPFLMRLSQKVFEIAMSGFHSMILKIIRFLCIIHIYVYWQDVTSVMPRSVKQRPRKLRMVYSLNTRIKVKGKHQCVFTHYCMPFSYTLNCISTSTCILGKSKMLKICLFIHIKCPQSSIQE